MAVRVHPMQTELLAASAGAVLAPAFAGPILARIPGGQIGQLAAGVAGVYFGSKIKNGIVKGAVVGAGAGIVVSALMAFVIRPTAQVTA